MMHLCITECTTGRPCRTGTFVPVKQ